MEASTVSLAGTAARWSDSLPVIWPRSRIASGHQTRPEQHSDNKADRSIDRSIPIWPPGGSAGTRRRYRRPVGPSRIREDTLPPTLARCAPTLLRLPLRPQPAAQWSGTRTLWASSSPLGSMSVSRTTAALSLSFRRHPFSRTDPGSSPSASRQRPGQAKGEEPHFTGPTGRVHIVRRRPVQGLPSRRARASPEPSAASLRRSAGSHGGSVVLESL
jgi:hypothetical protein